MGKKTAILITVGLTVFVLGAASVIAANVSRVQNPIEANTAALPPLSGTADTTVEALLARDAQYQERLETANRVIQQANETIANLQADQTTLQSQNETLLEREALYQQEIAKANRLLQQQATAPPVIAAAPQSAAPASDSASLSREEEHDDDREYEYEHEDEDDD